jgi:flagellin
MAAPIGILTNVASINASRNLSTTSRELGMSMNKLSSGLRITGAADDAAGIAVATGFEATTRSQVQAQRNANDGAAMLQTAEGAYGQIADIMIRMRELAVQASNDTLTDSDRGYLNTEFTQLVAEIDRVSAVTEFNGLGLLDAANTYTYQIGTDNDTNHQLKVDLVQVNAAFVKVDAAKVETLADAQAALDSIDEGLVELNEERAVVGASINQLTWASDSLGVANENLSRALSQIRDVDIARESANFASRNVLMQSGVAMLAQANQQPNLALRLLG